MNTMKSVYGDPKTAEGTTEADSSKKVLDLVDIYETNPGLQRIRKIKKQPQHPKRIILKDTCNHKVLKRVKRKTARRSNSLPRNRNNSVPLPPKNKTLLKRKLTPRDVTKRRFKREEVSFGNREDGTNIDPLKEKGDFPKSQRRYMKSEFDVFTELDKMKITDMTVVLSAPSVSTTSQNIDEENVSYISQGGQPKNSLGTECAAEKWNKVCIFESRC